MRLNMEISKDSCITCKQTLFVYIFAMKLVKYKRLCHLNARECRIKEDLTTMAASLFHRI